LRRGVNIQFDTLGAPFAIAVPEIDNRPNVDAILELVKRGYASRILLSQDVCTRFQMRKYGGFGYNFVLTNLTPYLQHKDMAKQDIEMMVKRNPRRLLTFVKPLPLRAP
jgi:phosphotriesterase-related protein